MGARTHEPNTATRARPLDMARSFIVNQLRGEAVIKNFKAEQSIHLIDKDKSVLSQIRVRMTGERGQSLEPEEAWWRSTV